MKSSGAVATWPFSLRGSFVTYTQPHTYLRTHWGPGHQDDPLIVNLEFRGRPLANINVMISVSLRVANAAPLIVLNAGDLHAFTDINGEVFGAGPGVVIAASCTGCSNVDHVLEAYAPGVCAALPYLNSSVSAGSNRPGPTGGLLPNRSIISVRKAVPIICPYMRYGWIDVQLSQSDTTSLSPSHNLLGQLASLAS